MDKQKIRTRFAPSPTGYMHIGNLRTALYAYLFAKHNKGTFVLRIEDTDQKRFVADAEEVIYRTLRKANLLWDEGPDIGGNYGPYVQSQRKDIYQKYAEQLIEKGNAYYCFCEKSTEEASNPEVIKKHSCDCDKLTKEQVVEKKKTQPFVIRQKMPKSGATTFVDEVFGEITVPNEELDDQILIKSDGLPTYNFANVVDDHLMEISHVIRGQEYLSSAPKYQLLYEAFGWTSPKTIHLSVIEGKNEDGSVSKLSKRHGAVSFEDLVAIGYLPEAIINYVALLGWSPKQEREIFSLSELVELFNIEGIVKTNPMFDYKKLDWVNGQYIATLPREKFLELAEPYLSQMPKCVAQNWYFASTLAQSRIVRFNELPTLFAFLDNYGDFDLEMLINKKNKTTLELSKELLIDLCEQIEKLTTWDNAGIYAILEDLSIKKELKLGAVMWVSRITATASPVTPGGASEMMYLLGQDEVLRRFRRTIERLGQ